MKTVIRQSQLEKHQAREKRLGVFINFAPKTRPYVGIRHDGTREIFNASAGPTEELYGQLYVAVIGPFKTIRGAKFMRDYGTGNPHCQHVGDAERLAKIYS